MHIPGAAWTLFLYRYKGDLDETKKKKQSNWKHLCVSYPVGLCAFFHIMVMKDKDQILSNISPFNSSSVCEVQAYHCDVVSRFTLLIWCVIWLAPSHYKLHISSVNMHLLTERDQRKHPDL